MIFFKNMPLTFLKNIRLFNKKNHTPARTHPKRGHISLLWNPGRLGKAHSPNARTRTYAHGGGAEFSSFAEERRSTCPPRARARPPEKRIAFTMSTRTPTHMGKAHTKSRPLQKTIPLQKNEHTAPILPPTGNIEKRDSVRIKVLNEGGWEIGKRETR